MKKNQRELFVVWRWEYEQTGIHKKWELATSPGEITAH